MIPVCLHHLYSLVTLQMKTWSVALVLCLNIGVDPPDIVKTNPCARQECWIGEPPRHTHTQTHIHCYRLTIDQLPKGAGGDR